MVTNERLIETIGRTIKAEHMGFIVNGNFLDAFEIDSDDVDDFLGEYCVSRGTEDNIIDYFYEKCLEEFERRMNCFECLTDEAYQFIAYEVMSYLLHSSPTMSTPSSFYSSFIDVLTADDDMHFCVKIDDEFFIFDFSDNDYKYRMDECYHYKFDVGKHIETFRKRLIEYITQKTDKG